MVGPCWLSFGLVYITNNLINLVWSTRREDNIEQQNYERNISQGLLAHLLSVISHFLSNSIKGVFKDLEEKAKYPPLI